MCDLKFAKLSLIFVVVVVGTGEAKSIYTEATNQIEHFSHLTTKLLYAVVLPCFTVAPSLYSYFQYYIMEQSAENAFQLPAPATYAFISRFNNISRNFAISVNQKQFLLLLSFNRYPNNWKTPIAYFFTTIVFSVESHYMFVVYLVFIGLFLGVCRFFMAFATDLKSRLIALENVIQQYADDETNQLKSLEAMETTIHEFIEFHSDVKQ